RKAAKEVLKLQEVSKPKGKAKEPVSLGSTVSLTEFFTPLQRPAKLSFDSTTPANQKTLNVRAAITCSDDEWFNILETVQNLAQNHLDLSQLWKNQKPGITLKVLDLLHGAYPGFLQAIGNWA
ncbi:hypothetical protein K7432_018440, partial [Basidiobolus ranarum]